MCSMAIDGYGSVDPSWGLNPLAPAVFFVRRAEDGEAKSRGMILQSAL